MADRSTAARPGPPVRQVRARGTGIGPQRLLLCGGLLLGACAQQSVSNDASPAGAAVVTGNCAAHPLRAEARRTGALRVLVRLRVELRPEGELTAAEMAAQRARLQAVQQRVLDRLAGTAHTVLRRYTLLPMLALRVDEAALCRLLGMAEVEGVSADTADPPAP